MPFANGTATSVNWAEFSSEGYLVKNATWVEWLWSIPKGGVGSALRG